MIDENGGESIPKIEEKLKVEKILKAINLQDDPEDEKFELEEEINFLDEEISILEH